MVDRDIVYAKIGNIQNCLQRIRKVTGMDPERLEDWDVQDIYVLNLQRASQAAIDLAAHVVADEALGVPANLRENFTLLREAGVIEPELERRMVGLVGFRNVAVHEYQALDIDVLKGILQHHLGDFEEFAVAVLVHYGLQG